MPSVTVDLEDLETLVMTSGALKTIEGALATRKADPFIRQYLDFTSAHDRLASVMRNARRAEAGTLVPWDGELDEVETRLLRLVEEGEIEHVTARAKREEKEVDSLAAKGCIVIGNFVKGVLWAGDTAPDIELDPNGYPVKITQRGREKLVKIDEKKGESDV